MKTILFDLDNTLYPPERELFSLIDVRINRYMCDVAGIDPAEVDGLRRRYWHDYGVTLQGLIRHHDVSPEDYLEYVHDIDVASRLEPDSRLRRELASLPMHRAVFTNGSRGHAERVLKSLQVDDLFAEIYDIRVANYLPKPDPAPYLKVLDHLGAAGSACIMVEDTVANLKTAKELGMATVLVGKQGEEPFVDVRVGRACEVPAAVADWS